MSRDLSTSSGRKDWSLAFFSFDLCKASGRVKVSGSCDGWVSSVYVGFLCLLELCCCSGKVWKLFREWVTVFIPSGEKLETESVIFANLVLLNVFRISVLFASSR